MVTGTRPWLRQARSGEIAGEATAEGPLTLVGLMGVLLQSAIVFTVAIPNFLGLTGSVVQHGAQSRLTKALTAAANLYKDDDRSFNGLTPAKLSSSARKFAWTTGGCGISPRNRISFYVTNADAAGDGQVLLLAGNSANNTCWYIAEVEVQPALETITGSGLG